MNNFKSLFFLLFIFSVLATNAQVGIGTTTPTAALDISATNDGLLIPRVALTGTATVLPILTGTASELVYNTATISDVTPGFYYLSTATGPWVRLAAASASATTDWSVTGNTGIVDGTNYIGTAASTDVDVAFRRNNIAAGKIGLTNTSYGVRTLATNTSGIQSTAIGVNALASNQTASDNTAIGYNALQSNTTTGTHTAVGSSALKSNTTGIENTGIGYKSLISNTTGGNNVAVGQETLATNTSGEHNTAVGHQSLQFNKSNRQTALGFQALQGDAALALSAGADNTSVGYQSIQLVTIGTGNAALGFRAGWLNSTGSNNVFLGRLAGSATTTGSNNVFLGNEAGSVNTGSNNVFLGNEAGKNETDSNKLYISNSATTPTTSLIYGDFTSSPKILRTNSQFQIGDPSGTGYVFPTARGTIGQTLTTNGTGVLSWTSTASPNSWDISGNTITSTSNFMGTTNDFDVAFRRNNIAAGKIGLTNTSYGVGTLAANTSGIQSTAIGVNALASNQTASDNTAIGYNALQSNTTTGTHTAVGSSALKSNTTGIENTGIGYKSLISNTTGGKNVALGQETLATNSSGEHNTAVGHQSLQFNKSNRQTALGFQALQGDAALALSAGADNTSVGYQSMQLVTIGTGNAALGFRAGWLNSTGSNNVFLGRLAGSATTIGDNNVFLGNEAGKAETGSNKLYISNSATTPTTSLIYGDFTSSPKILRTNSQFQIGDPAPSGTGYVFPTARGTNGQTLTTNGTGVLSWSSPAAPTSWDINGNAITSDLNFIGTTNNFDVLFKRFGVNSGKIGSTNTAFGFGALGNDVSFIGRNTAIGVNALNNSFNGNTNNNVAVGADALDATAGGQCAENVAVGADALGSLGSGSFVSFGNVAIGFQASIGLQSGNQNVSVGRKSLNKAITVLNCTAIGEEALFNTTANNNTALGRQAGSLITTGLNNIAIGYNAQVPVATASNQIRMGDEFIQSATIQVPWTTTSDRRLKSNIENSKLGLDFIKKIRPVSYFRTNDKDKKTEYGFIAQELELALTKAGDKNNGIINKDDAGMYSVRYNDFTSITVKAIQEQQEIIEQLKNTNNELLKTNAELLKSNLTILKRLEKLEKKKSE